MRLVALGTALIATMVAAGGPAHADPTPEPSPPYQIAGPSGPQFPGVQQYPPICGVQPLACALHYDAGTGTWNAPPGTDSP